MSNESSVTARQLHAYLDDELSTAEAATVAAALEEHAELRAEHEQARGLGAIVCASLEAEARAVPAARFEQIWDEIDRAIERDSRLQAEADRGVSIWSRLWAALKPARVPILAAAGAAAVTLVVVSTGSEEPNKTESVASVDEREAPATEPEASPDPVPEAEPDKLADGESVKAPPSPSEPTPEIVPMPVPENSDAEIHGIEFGGKNGRIGHTGTVTVLYVEEDDAQSTNSERSL